MKDGLDMQCVEVAWDNPDAVLLRNAQSADVSSRYGSPINLYEPTPDGLVTTVVLYESGPAALPVGCAALVDVTGTEDVFDGRKTVEMRRMFIRPELRGNGFSRGIITALHDLARAHGFEQIVLTSGTKQPEAVGLYKSQGYQDQAPYGIGKQWDTALFFKHDLSQDAAVSA